MKKYLMYHLRWQAGIFISWPVLHVLEIIGITSILFKMTVVSFVGACIFWHIDKWIFKGGGMKLVDEALTVPSKWGLVLEVLKHSWLFIKKGCWWKAMKSALRGKIFIEITPPIEVRNLKKERVKFSPTYLFSKVNRDKNGVVDSEYVKTVQRSAKENREYFAEVHKDPNIEKLHEVLDTLKHVNEPMIYKGEAAEKFGSWLSVDKENAELKKAKPRKRGSKVVNKKKAGPKRKKA